MIGIVKAQNTVIKPDSNACFAVIVEVYLQICFVQCSAGSVQAKSFVFFWEKGLKYQAWDNFSSQNQVRYCRHFSMSKGSLNVLQIPHVTTCWQTFLGLADGEFLARVPGIFHCLIPGACEEDEAVWLPALSFRFS